MGWAGCGGRDAAMGCVVGGMRWLAELERACLNGVLRMSPIA